MFYKCSSLSDIKPLYNWYFSLTKLECFQRNLF
jgi:hypothetical protein